MAEKSQYDLSEFNEEKKADDYDLSEFSGQMPDNIQQNMPQGNYWKNPVTRTLADVTAGGAALASDTLNIPYGIVSTIAAHPTLRHMAERAGFTGAENLTPEMAEKVPHVPDINWLSKVGVPNPNILDQIISKGTQYAPEIYAGGKGLLSLGNLALKGAEHLISPASKIAKLGEQLSPEKIAQIENTYNLPFKQISEKVGKETIFSNPKDSAYLKFIEEHPNVGKAMGDIHENFMENPIYDNAHSLKKALGDEARGYARLELKQGNLLEAQKIERNMYKKAFDAINKDRLEFLEKKDSKLLDMAKQADKEWAQNVDPWRQSALTYRDLEAAESSPQQFLKRFSKMQGKSKSISTNRPDALSPVPNEIIPTLGEISKMIKRKKAMTGLGMTAVGTGALYGAGRGIKDLYNLFSSKD